MNSQYDEFRDAFEQFKRNLAYITGRDDDLQELTVSKDIGMILFATAAEVMKDPTPGELEQTDLDTGDTVKYQWMKYSGVIIKWKA